MMIAVPTPTFPSDNNFVPIVAEKTIQPPTDRSIPPVRITNVMPIAAMPQVTDCANTLLRFETESAVEATAEGKSIFAYDKSGKVAAAYEQLGKEVAEIGEKQRNQNRADRIR